jgi:quinolinate synthase
MENDAFRIVFKYSNKRWIIVTQNHKQKNQKKYKKQFFLLTEPQLHVIIQIHFVITTIYVVKEVKCTCKWVKMTHLKNHENPALPDKERGWLTAFSRPAF